MQTTRWEIGQLHLRPSLVWSMAVSSVRVRLGRALLTCLTIATATAFMMYLLTMARRDDPTDRQSWQLMLALALIVAAAGVMNAMLMAVSQRYREIGTMKCLGALDSLVFASVLLEAAFVGLVGAAGGALAGAAISLVIGVSEFGGEAMGHLRFSGLAWKVLAVFLAGMALTTLGAAIPAWVASRMAPVEAMRGEK